MLLVHRYLIYPLFVVMASFCCDGEVQHLVLDSLRGCSAGSPSSHRLLAPDLATAMRQNCLSTSKLISKQAVNIRRAEPSCCDHFCGTRLT